MENIDKILKKANIIPLLKLAVKRDGGGTDGTGPHRVKILKDKVGKRTDFDTQKEIYVIWLHVEEDGVERRYPVRVKDKNSGEVHYLIQKLGEFKEGDEIIMEYKRQGKRGYIDVQMAKPSKVGAEGAPVASKDETIGIPTISDDEIPIIEENEEHPTNTKGESPPLDLEI